MWLRILSLIGAFVLAWLELYLLKVGFSIFSIYMAATMLISFQVTSMLIRGVIKVNTEVPKTFVESIQFWSYSNLMFIVGFLIFSLLAYLINMEIGVFALVILFTINYILVNVTLANTTPGKEDEGN